MKYEVSAVNLNALGTALKQIHRNVYLDQQSTTSGDSSTEYDV